MPLKARPGMDSLDASVAAPTVPEIRVARPRFAVEGERICYFETRGRDCFNGSVLHPTLGPATAMSGAPPKNFGASVSMP